MIAKKLLYPLVQQLFYTSLQVNKMTLFCYLTEELHRLCGALGIEVYERVVEYQGTRCVLRQCQGANGKAHRKIHEVERSGA